jgi:NAD(P)-dependent dehydrogenase (short-subunit alcohol dehydrogenase family)
MIAKAQEYGEIKYMINGAGVSPSQASIETILKVDLYGTADEMANIAELLMSDAGAFITGSTFLADGGATASYYYGPLQPGLETGMEEGRQ